MQGRQRGAGGGCITRALAQQHSCHLAGGVAPCCIQHAGGARCDGGSRTWRSRCDATQLMHCCCLALCTRSVRGLRISYSMAAIDIGLTDPDLEVQQLVLKPGEGITRVAFKMSK
jgi:hypothetical protein